MGFKDRESELLLSIQKGNSGDYNQMTFIEDTATGNTYLDFRKWYTDENGELKPTKQGVQYNGEVINSIVIALLPYLDFGASDNLEGLLRELLDN